MTDEEEAEAGRERYVDQETSHLPSVRVRLLEGHGGNACCRQAILIQEVRGLIHVKKITFFKNRLKKKLI